MKIWSQKKRASSPFRRVRTEEIDLIECQGGEILDDRMRVGGKGGVVGWGVRAHEKLKTVKGKKFTVSLKEKVLIYNGWFKTVLYLMNF